MSKTLKTPSNPFDWRIYAIAVLTLLTLNVIHTSADKKKAFERGVTVGRRQVIDSINKADSVAKARSTLSLPIPSQMRNQAATAKLPINSAKQAINR